MSTDHDAKLRDEAFVEHSIRNGHCAKAIARATVAGKWNSSHISRYNEWCAAWQASRESAPPIPNSRAVELVVPQVVMEQKAALLVAISRLNQHGFENCAVVLDGLRKSLEQFQPVQGSIIAQDKPPKSRIERGKTTSALDLSKRQTPG